MEDVFVIRLVLLVNFAGLALVMFTNQNATQMDVLKILTQKHLKVVKLVIQDVKHALINLTRLVRHVLKAIIIQIVLVSPNVKRAGMATIQLKYVIAVPLNV
jgi:hypothetical protein